MNTAELIHLYPMMTNARIAELLGVSKSNISITAHRLGLKKDSGYLSKVNSDNANKRWNQ